MTRSHMPSRPPRLATLPLEAFAPPDAWIIDDADMSSADRLRLYVAAEEIGDAHTDFVRDPASAIVLPFSQRSDVLFFLMNAVVLAVCTTCGALAGGVSNYHPIVFTAHRGLGIGRDFHLVADENGMILFQPEYFSRAGYAARLAAHKAAVVQAIREGRVVHPENRMRYRTAL